ncbi:MAG: FKBP-type peptidyl-prolyl cis-trans isomerase [Bacteroidetes bacterium]|nr:FKBP-type peptidyl-prolyl cis-trans isomerase [Bacteroidota bacterium]
MSSLLCKVIPRRFLFLFGRNIRPGRTDELLPYFLKYLIITTTFLFVFFSCKHSNEKYPGYTQTSSGLYYKLNAFGDSKHKPSKEDHLKVSIICKTESDSVFWDTQDQNPAGTVILSAFDACSKGLLGNGIMGLTEGDSVTFIIPANELFVQFFQTPLPLFINKSSIVKVDVKLSAVLDTKEYQAELEKYRESLSVWDVEEQRRIRQYIKSKGLNALLQSNGMYYIPQAEGKGPQADSGKTVMIHYSGSFLSGRKFDSSNSNIPFEFRIGDEFQVIWGLGEGIKLMKEGGKAKFIIPSYLGFGENGSSTGIVPPHTTLVYEVELIKVKTVK